jgi:hypothetical protein
MRNIKIFQGDTVGFYYFVNETSFSLTGFTIRVLLTEKVSGLSAEVGSTTPYCDNFFVHYLGGDADLNTLKNLVLQAELVGNTQVCHIAHCPPPHPTLSPFFITPTFTSTILESGY